ncbi:MAG: oligosaccharide flippase family protein [Planctomycetota bacterium]|nr:oligosaccharide flippase family protein [Planctomycetota bacterium]
MSDSPQGVPSETTTVGLGAVAIRGSLLNSGQWLANKILTVGAMILIAYFLTPSEYGVGVLALAIFSFAAIFQPMTFGDVLIAHPKRFALLAKSASGLALIIGCFSSLIILLISPVAAYFYTDYPTWWIIGLLVILAIRPILEAKLMLPFSAMRLSLSYPRIALIDGVTQLGATILSVVLAAVGGKATALILPQIVSLGVKSRLYLREVNLGKTARFHPKLAAFLFRSFAKASAAQYMHNVIVMLEILVLGFVSGKVETGIFGLAFSIASQANIAIAFQLGVILQPIFGRLGDDPDRQIAGFLKAQRVLSAICVPVCFTQALIAEPLFRLLLEPKWYSAIPVFQVISLMQAFYFATSPSMACLRAQRKFGTLFVWQAIQLVIALPLYWFGAKWSGALGVALASVAIWAISSPIVVWLCTINSSGKHLTESIAIFAIPLCVCAPIFTGFFLVIQWLGRYGVVGDVLSLIVLGPAATLFVIWIMRFLHPDTRTTLDTLTASFSKRLSRFRK